MQVKNKKLLISAFTIILFATNGAQARSWLDTAKDLLKPDVSSEVKGSNGSTKINLTRGEISTGLREALNIGTKKVVEQLGVKNGFNTDPKIHIPLPGSLEKVDSILSTVGMDSLTDDLELKLNRAAEAATPKAKALFIKAISQMTITDAKNILTGPQDAATQYLRSTMGADLTKSMQPIVTDAMQSAGAIQAYDAVMGEYAQIPFMPDVKANINAYVVEKAMDGIFYYVAKEEAAIRTNPVARTTDILKKVFSN